MCRRSLRPPVSTLQLENAEGGGKEGINRESKTADFLFHFPRNKRRFLQLMNYF